MSANDELRDSPTPTVCDKMEKQEPVDVSEREVTAPAAPVDDFPDGGLRAWLVIVGAMCTTFSTFGYVNSWGVFQSYYEETLLKDYSSSTIAWIGSVQYSLVFLPALLMGRMFDLGYHKGPMIMSAVALVVATFLVAECTQYYQFLLAQGFAVGIASGCLFGPLSACVAHYFKRRRGHALGLVAVGSSMGGTLLPIAIKNLIPAVGFPWTMRIVGFILIVTIGVALITVDRRLPPVKTKGGLFNLKAFTNIPYTLFCISAFISFLGLYTVLTFIDVSASMWNISPNVSFYLVSIANAASGIGRLCSGLLSDKIGPMNVMIPFTLAAGALTYAWPFAHTEGSIIVVAIIYGLCIGSYVSLFCNPVIEMGEMSDAGRRIGMLLTITSIGALVGPPISGAINSSTHGYNAVGYYAGSTVVFAIAIMTYCRWMLTRRIWAKI